MINLKKNKDMTRQEFIDRTGFTPTEDHFKAIHEEYMAAGDGVDKDIFCERWIKNNGVQLGYDWMHSRLEGTEGELAAVKEANRELSNRKDVEIGLLKDRIKILEGQKVALEVKEERVKERYADRTDEFFRYRKALMIARLFLKALKPAANSEELVMTLNEVDSALASGTESKA